MQSHNYKAQLHHIETKLDHLTQLLTQSSTSKLDDLLTLGAKIMAAIDDQRVAFEALKTEIGVIGDDMDTLKAKFDAAVAAAGVNNDPAIQEITQGMVDLTARLQATADRDMPPATPVP